MERSKPRQILHIIGAYTMSCRQGSKRGAYIGPRANIYCALGYARANAQPKARQPTRPKGHSIYTFSFFSSFSLTKARAAGFVLFCCLGYDVSGNNAPKGSGRRGGACPAPTTKGRIAIKFMFPGGVRSPALRGNKKHYAVGAGHAPPAVLRLQQHNG